MITVNELSYRYAASAAPALSGLSFAVAPGEIFGFLGPSGAGKSTTQKILMKLLGGYQGAVSVFGRDLRSWGSAYYERVGVGFELPSHFLRLSARRNLEYFGALYRGPTRPIGALLARLGLEEDADTPVERFSKGMQTRLGVARALLHQPELIFLDEPTSGLDPVSARTVKELIREQRAEGRTVVLTTHNMTLADELCDRVALIVDGRIMQIDTPRALRLRYGAPHVRVEYSLSKAEHHELSAATQRANGSHGRQLEPQTLNGGVSVAEFPLEGLADNAEFQGLLRTAAVQTIHSREATLEDVFIAVTGRGLA
jgi:fluoroquinolone transport system ATP-binding protein